MRVWNFKVKSNPKEISKKLESTFKDVGGFAFNLNSGSRCIRGPKTT
jgi:hypothetical protein